MNQDGAGPASERPTLGGLQVIRGVAALMVLFYHAAEKQSGEYHVSLPGLSWFSAFGYAGVDLFFVLSGFVITWITWPDFGQPSRLPAYLLKRLVRVVPVFWAAWILSAIVFFGFLDVRFFQVRGGSIFSQTARSVLLVDPAAHGIIPQAWTLSWELMFYGIFAIVLLFRRGLLPVFLALWAAAVAAGQHFSWSALPADPFCLHFILGSAAGMGARLRPSARPRVFIGLGLAAWLTVIVALSAGALSVSTQARRILLFGPASALLLYGTASLDLLRPPRYPRASLLLGDASYALYLTHVTVLFALHMRFPRIASGPGHVLWAAAAIVLSVAAGLATHLWIEKPLLAGLRAIPRLPARAAALGAAAAVMLGIAGTLHAVYTPPEAVVLTDARTPGSFPPLDAIRLAEEIQGWADVRREPSGDLSVSGWAIDREREEMADAVLVYVDGAVRRILIPAEERPGVLKATAWGGRQPGFSVVLPRGMLEGAACVRFVAALRGQRYGRLGIQLEGKPDPSALGVSLRGN